VSTLAAAAHDYLRVRRPLGYKLERQGRQLLHFVAYLDRVGATTVTIAHAIGWATLPAGATGGYWSDRLSVVRQFARYLQTIDPACEVPAKGLLPYRRERPIPFLFTPADIERVMRATRQLRGELHAATTQTLIGTMAVTGIRVGEAIGLDRDDVDRPGQLIRVIDGKFGKSREVAVHQTTIAALDSYAEVRDRVCPRPRCDAFFLSRNGTRLATSAFTWCSSASSPPVGLRTARPGALRGRTACATASRSTRCATGTPTTSTCRPGCRC
jgi:integrase/recombinase XerD